MKQLIPVPVRRQLRGWLNSAKNTPFAVDLLELRRWQIARKDVGINAAPRNNPRRLLVLPSDPWSIHQSRGDEAMIEAAAGEMKRAYPDLEIYIVTATAAASADVRVMGFKPLELWKQPFSYETVAQELSIIRPDFGVILGADVLDGYYSPVDAARMLLVADLMAAFGAKVSVLGFSFNSRPAKALREVFRLIDPGVVLNLRDAISLRRFDDFARKRARLVADAAFMLTPRADTAAVKAIAATIARQRAQGRKVFVFNIHPMLFKKPEPAKLRKMIELAASAMERLSRQHNVSWVLLAHDYRPEIADDNCLRPLADRLKPTLGEHVHHVEQTLSAGEIKAVVGLVDGVITGRMHLAIAALGQGTPVAAITYQDKFQGLFAHFGISEQLLLSPAQFLNGDSFEQFVEHFIGAYEAAGDQVRQALPDVMELSRANIAPLLGDSAIRMAAKADGKVA
ncbi:MULTISPECIES: polysaccharide pyruvyl transferase family protein [Bradyrhizobium]|uniref:polysaccharide pyruvyl transferase family protein n=1 Tax=Bradyrhizobium TaxID=374 RepID=UPI00211EBF88|nr:MULTISPECIES: polysaccharide pyruvyl transferase family protein [Bradyrhizobium]UWU67578.1 polysaccharide pyruvyl transferase family protein [Bradyrhizobium sp. NC92]